MRQRAELLYVCSKAHAHLVVLSTHQDAHEFLNWLLNDIAEALEKEGRAAATAARRASRDASRSSSRSSSRAASPTKAARSPSKTLQGRSPSLQVPSWGRGQPRRWLLWAAKAVLIGAMEEHKESRK